MSDQYQCFQCGSIFTRLLRSLDREFQRVHFDLDPWEVEIRGSEGLTCYCSDECQGMHVPVVMAAEKVPIPVVPPGIGPIESCAVCGGLVDTTQWHQTYSTSLGEQVAPSVVQPLDTADLARVCSKCKPASVAAASVERSEAAHTA